jgi:arylsulfatase A-like enzyme
VWEIANQAFAAHAATPDRQKGESELPGGTITFPHRLDSTHDPARAFRATPFADEVLLSLGLAAVDAHRSGETPLLLAISLSSNDYIGHLYGPDSVEAWDELYRLDAQLGRFFVALDDRVGADGWAVLLTGDHGSTTLPEAASEKTRPWCARKGADPWQRACGPVYRVVPDELAPKLEAAAARIGGEGPWVSGIADPYVYLTAKARALGGDRGERLRRAILDALLAEPAVLRVADAHQVAPRCAPNDSLDALLCHSLVSGAPGDYYVMLKPGSFFDPDYVIGYGTSHGSPYLYDRAVPLLARAPGRIPAGKVLDREPSTTFSRTAAGLLGISPLPAARAGTDLSHPARRK